MSAPIKCEQKAAVKAGAKQPVSVETVKIEDVKQGAKTVAAVT